jgi:hypothetical protein
MSFGSKKIESQIRALENSFLDEIRLEPKLEDSIRWTKGSERDLKQHHASSKEVIKCIDVGDMVSIESGRYRVRRNDIQVIVARVRKYGWIVLSVRRMLKTFLLDRNGYFLRCTLDGHILVIIDIYKPHRRESIPEGNVVGGEWADVKWTRTATIKAEKMHVDPDEFPI